MRTPATLAALLLGALACSDGISPVDQPVDDPPDPSEPPPEVEGDALYAVDNDNNLFLFGTLGLDTMAATWRITGLPFLEHIVGIDFRPSTGELYGVGSDGRVYIIDTATGAATPVASEPFTTEISNIFDHFGMSFDPETERIRLIAGWGGNWSIDPDDGTAIRQGDAHYAEGDPNEGKPLNVSAHAYVPAEAFDGSVLADMRGAAGTAADAIEDLIYDGFDGGLARMIDPETGAFESLGPVGGIAASSCMAMTFGPGCFFDAVGPPFLVALAPLAAALGPEVAGAYGLIRMTPGGLGAFAGALGFPGAQTAFQGLAFAGALGGGGACR